MRRGRTAEYYIYNRFEVAVEGLWQDLRYATRLVRRTPRNSGIAVAILALGIGANTAVFSAVNHVLLRPLPFSTPERLIRVRDAVVSADGQLHPFNMSPRDILVLREAAVFEGVIGFGGTNMTLIGGDAPERVSVVLQTEGIEATLNVTPSVGRGFSQEELRHGRRERRGDHQRRIVENAFRRLAHRAWFDDAAGRSPVHGHRRHAAALRLSLSGQRLASHGARSFRSLAGLRGVRPDASWGDARPGSRGAG